MNRSGSRWGGTILIYGGAVLIGINLVAVPASSVILKGLHGFSDQQYGSVFLPQLVMAITGALIAGPAVLRMSLKSMYLIALLAFALSLGGLALSSLVRADNAIFLMMLSTGLFGFGFGFGGGPLNGLVFLQFPNKTSSALTALHMMAGVGLMVGPIYFSAFESQGSWLFGPVLAMIVAVVFLIGVTLSLQNDKPQVSSEKGKGLPNKEVYFWIMIGIAFLYGFVEATFSNWAVIFVNEARNLSTGVAATALSAFWGGLTVGRFVTTFVVRRLEPFKIWLCLPVAMALALYVIPIAAGPAQIIAAFAFGGIACSAFFPLMVAISTEPFPHAVSWIASMLTAALMSGIGIVSYLVGSLIQTISIDDIYLYSIVYPVVIVALMLVGRRVEKLIAKRIKG